MEGVVYISMFMCIFFQNFLEPQNMILRMWTVKRVPWSLSSKQPHSCISHFQRASRGDYFHLTLNFDLFRLNFGEIVLLPKIKEAERIK